MTIDYCRYVDMYVYAFYTILYLTILYYTLLYSAILYTIDYILYAINNTLYTIYHILYTTYYILYNILYTIHYTYILKLIQRSVKGFMSGIKPSCRWKGRQCSEQFSVLDVIWGVWCGDRLFARTILRCSALVARQFAFAIATASARVTLIQLIPWFSLNTHWTYWTSEASSLKFGSCRLSQVLLRLWWSREMFGGAVADPFCHTVALCPCRTTQPGRQSVDAWVLQVRIFLSPTNMSEHVRTVGLSMSWRFKCCARWFALICQMIWMQLKMFISFRKGALALCGCGFGFFGVETSESHRVGTALRWRNLVGTAFEAFVMPSRWPKPFPKRGVRTGLQEEYSE